MYNPNDEKLVLSMDEIKAAMDDEEGWRGYAYESHMWPWVHPRNVTGLDLERLIRVNRARHYWWEFESVPGVDYEKVRDPDYQDDDDLVADYLDTVVRQRYGLSMQHPHVQPIPAVQHFAALLYMAMHWDSEPRFWNVDRSWMTLEEVLECLDLYEAAFRETPHCHLKHRLPDVMDSFFCNSFIPPEVEGAPIFREFLDDPRNLDRLGHMRELFRESCPEMVAKGAREEAEAAEASALIDAARRKRGHVFWTPESHPLSWTPEERAITYFDSAVTMHFETKWLERARAGKKSLFKWKFHLARWQGMPKDAPIDDDLLKSLSEYTSDPEAMRFLFRHLDEGGEKFSDDAKRVLAYIRRRYPA